MTGVLIYPEKKSDQITSQKWQLLWLPLKLGIHGVITFVFILLFKHFIERR